MSGDEALDALQAAEEGVQHKQTYQYKDYCQIQYRQYY